MKIYKKCVLINRTISQYTFSGYFFLGIFVGEENESFCAWIQSLFTAFPPEKNAIICILLSNGQDSGEYKCVRKTPP